MHDSYTPLGGMVPLVNIQLGEVIFGGVGSGLYGMLAFAIVAMFVAGLMVGRTPEYLGKKLEAKEVKMIDPGAPQPAAVDLRLHRARRGRTGRSRGPANPGPHGFSEILYAFTSATGNNGSAFAGISANTLFYNTTLAAAMLIGRFIFVIPDAGGRGLARRRRSSLRLRPGLSRRTSPLFVGLLVGVILIIGGLTYFPAVALGPVVEQVAMTHGTLFATSP